MYYISFVKSQCNSLLQADDLISPQICHNIKCTARTCILFSYVISISTSCLVPICGLYLEKFDKNVAGSATMLIKSPSLHISK